MVRQFTYSDKRILTDSYRTDVDGAIVQKTTFEYDDTDPDGTTNQLTNPTKALKKVTFGQADALQNEVVYLIKPAGFVGYSQIHCRFLQTPLCQSPLIELPKFD